MTDKKIRVRYAPSPTGLLHIGNARTALFNYVFARHYKGEMIIRIEDTDVSRNVAGGEESQLKYLKWMGINWDEGPDILGTHGPYHQLERLDLYTKYANELIKMGLAYKEYNEENKEKFAIRMKVLPNKKYQFLDLVRGQLEFDSKEIEDWIIIKENGIPTYNFAVVIDDHLMEITHVLRGEEHITNTPKQLMVYEAFGWEAPTFGHMAIIVNKNHKKLSKRDSDVIQFISQYDDLGYLPEAMFNFIALLGWSPTINQEILNQEEIINNFSKDRLSKAPAMFDVEKLNYLNSQYIKKLDISNLVKLCKPFLVEANIEIKNDLWLEKLLSIFQERLVYGKQIVTLYQEFLNHEFKVEKEALEFLKENDSKELINLFKNKLLNIEWNSLNIVEALKQSGKELNIKGKLLYMPLRIATTGEMHGPSLENILELVGREEVVARIDKTLKLV